MKRSLVAFIMISALGCSQATRPIQDDISGNSVAPQVRQGNPQHGWAVFSLPGSNQPVPHGIVAGPDGGMWYLETRGNSVDRFDVSSGNVKRHPIPSPSSAPQFITVGSDGALWFEEGLSRKIGRITTGGTISEYVIPDGSTADGTMALGADGDIWFAESGFKSIGAVSPSGNFRSYTLPSLRQPYYLAAGPDGNVWFTELGDGRIGKITTSGVVTEYTVPSGNGAEPFGIVSLAGALWFTENGTNKMGKITTDGTVTEYPLPIAQPSSLAVGPGGFLWFVINFNSSELAEFNPRTFTTRVLGTAPFTCCNYLFLAPGPDSNIYVTASDTNQMVVRVLDVMKTSPRSLSVTVGGSQSFTVTEKVYHGLWSAVSSNTNVATVLQSSPGVFSVTGVAPGAAKITVSDTIGNSIAEPVTVQ